MRAMWRWTFIQGCEHEAVKTKSGICRCSQKALAEGYLLLQCPEVIGHIQPCRQCPHGAGAKQYDSQALA